MLASLSIRNVALIERAELNFSDGLNVLSGETGAGKSVILDSIDFILGAKADKSMIRYGTDECSVRAEFRIGGNERAKEALAELDIEAEDDVLIISRKFTAEGKSSVKLNGLTVTASMLRGVTAHLVDVHGQSEHFYLLKESNQLRLLDAVAGERVSACKADVKNLLSERKRIREELSLLGGDEGERNRRMDVLRFQIEEIERAAIKEGEEEELLSRREKIAHAEKILSGLNTAKQALLSDGGGADAVGTARRALSGIARFEEAYGKLADRLENALAEISDIADEVDRQCDECDFDEREAERIENRLDEIKGLKKKYGGSVEAVAEFCENAKKELLLLSDSGERYVRLTDELTRTENKLFDACVRLTEARRQTAEQFTQRVTAELKTLNISSARFEIAFSEYSRQDVPKANAEGLDEIRFLFSANAGEPLKEMGKIISGGEMSRFMLAVKTQLSSVNGIGTYLFDEIDAGISGKTARVVAEKFCKIAQCTQIVAVSHLAQIASFADKQFFIEKTESDGRTFTEIREVEGTARLNEIARLSGGDGESDSALIHAAELLKNAEIYKNSLIAKK